MYLIHPDILNSHNEEKAPRKQNSFIFTVTGATEIITGSQCYRKRFEGLSSKMDYVLRKVR